MTDLAQLKATLAGLSEQERRKALSAFSAAELERLSFTWELFARPDQLPPPGDWRCWLLLGGRGSGKTRTASEYIRSEVESGRHSRIALISPTAETLRRDSVEGPSGILAVSPPWCRPNYEPSTRRIVWPNGAHATLLSCEEPDRARGINTSLVWLDELCAAPLASQMMDMIQMALRLSGPLGDSARMICSTTPRPLPVLKKLIADPGTVVTRSKTIDNASNLDS